MHCLLRRNVFAGWFPGVLLSASGLVWEVKNYVIRLFYHAWSGVRRIICLFSHGQNRFHPIDLINMLHFLLISPRIVFYHTFMAKRFFNVSNLQCLKVLCQCIEVLCQSVVKQFLSVHIPKKSDFFWPWLPDILRCGCWLMQQECMVEWPLEELATNCPAPWHHGERRFGRQFALDGWNLSSFSVCGLRDFSKFSPPFSTLRLLDTQNTCSVDACIPLLGVTSSI